MNAPRSTLLVLLVAWTTWPASAAENWIADGNFDARESFAWPGGTWQAEVVHGGRGALRLDADGGPKGANARHAAVEVGQAAAQEVMASCWLRLDARRKTGAIRGGLTLRVEMADGKALAWYGPFAIDECQSGSWVYREQRWVPPAGIVRIRPTIYLSGCEGSLYADEIRLGPPAAAARPAAAAIPLAVTGTGGHFRDFARFRWDSFRPAAQVFDLRDGKTNLQFLARIDVLEAAPAWLSSSGGSQYWTMASPQLQRMVHFYTRERLDLSEPGPRDVSLPMAGLSTTTDALAPGGWTMVTAGPKSFYVNPLERIAAEVRKRTGKNYWDVAKVENLNASLAPAGATAAFSLADLSSYRFRASARRRGNAVRVRPVLVDAQGVEVPLYGIDLAAVCAGKSSPLAAETAAEGYGTGDYLLAEAPAAATSLTLSGKVRLALGQKNRDVPFSLEVPVERAAGEKASAGRLELMGWDSPSYTLSATAKYGPESMRRLVADARRLGIGKLVIHARTSTETCYRSRLAAPESVQEFDAVGAAAEEGRRQGVEIQAGYILGVAQPCDLTRHPDWAALDRQGKPVGWYCYNHPDVRAFHSGLAAEIVARYPVAGVSLDYCRPGGGCRCARCASIFEARCGKRLQAVDDHDADWGTFQRECITEYLRQIRAAIRAARPGAGLGGYVWGRFGPDKDRAGQEWPRWLREGIFDFVAVGIYTPSTLQFRAQCEALAEIARRDPAHCQGRIIPLLGAGYIAHSFRGHEPAGEVMARHLAAAAEAGLGGAGFFTVSEVRVFPEILSAHGRAR